MSLQLKEINYAASPPVSSFSGTISGYIWDM